MTLTLNLVLVLVQVLKESPLQSSLKLAILFLKVKSLSVHGKVDGFEGSIMEKLSLSVENVLSRTTEKRYLLGFEERDS